MSKEIQKWADKAMFAAEPIDAKEGPKVYLLEMSSDPLGQIAAACKMYKGEVVRDLADVTNAERHEYFEQVQRTKLQAPFEFVKFHFLFEGVSRSFTHQMVRQRTAVYAQESLRFAVKEDMPQYLPPSLAGTMSEDEWEAHWLEETSLMGLNGSSFSLSGQAHDWAINHSSKAQLMRLEWDQHNRATQQAYNNLIDMGMPAEDARGRLPHDTLTRIHYSTDLRALLDHAGNRLCTQAQFEWRIVWAQIIRAIRDYGRDDVTDFWQYNDLARMFKPVCYLTGKCEFKANFDRACKIRERVDANEAIGRPSSEWGEEKVWGNSMVADPDKYMPPWSRQGQHVIPAIKPEEWLLDPSAAR